jgi:hypothetical protein
MASHPRIQQSEPVKNILCIPPVVAVCSARVQHQSVMAEKSADDVTQGNNFHGRIRAFFFYEKGKDGFITNILSNAATVCISCSRRVCGKKKNDIPLSASAICLSISRE